MNYGLLLLGEHTPDGMLRLASLAESGGFEAVWFADEKFYRDPFVSLTHLANHTRSVRLGTCVTDPFTRHPALIATATASLDEISGGRAVLGLGAGFSGLEAMAVERGHVVRTMRNAIGAIRRLWEGDTVSLEDEAFELREAKLDVSARPDTPILLASTSRQMLRLAGEVADEVMLGDLGSAEVIQPALAEVAQGAAKVGRSIESIPCLARLNVVLAQDVEDARRAIRPWILAYLWHAYPDWSRLWDYTPDWDERMKPLRDFINARGAKPRNVGDREQVLQYAPLLPESLVRRYALAGPPAAVVEQIAEVVACGITGIVIFPTPISGQTTESVLLEFMDRVLPRT